MLMPAVACFSKLKRDKRHTYRHPLPAVHQTYVPPNTLFEGLDKSEIDYFALDRFFGQAFSRRFPASWVRFLWFMTSLAIASFSLIVGQGKSLDQKRSKEIKLMLGVAYASLFLTTLPHTSLDAGTWVWSWVISTSQSQ